MISEVPGHSKLLDFFKEAMSEGNMFPVNQLVEEDKIE